MKHQEVSVDFWAMGKAMLTYGALTALLWLMMRLFNAVFMLPRRLRAQQDSMEATLKELQRRYPDLNITEEDLRNADKELEELTKDIDEETTEEKDNKEQEGEEKEVNIEKDSQNTEEHKKSK